MLYSKYVGDYSRVIVIFNLEIKTVMRKHESRIVYFWNVYYWYMILEKREASSSDFFCGKILKVSNINFVKETKKEKMDL